MFKWRGILFFGNMRSEENYVDVMNRKVKYFTLLDCCYNRMVVKKTLYTGLKVYELFQNLISEISNLYEFN